MVSVVLISFVIACTVQSVSSSASEAKLIAHLFSDHYDHRVRPAKEANKPLHLHVENIHLKRLTNIDEKEGTVNIGLWIGLSWNDSSLSWSPESYDGIKYLAVRANQIWTPDLILFSGWGVAEHSLRDSEEHDVLLHSSGLVLYYPSAKLDLPCLNRTSDTELQCNFGLGSWVMSSDMLETHLATKDMDTTKYVMDPHYHLTSDSLEKLQIKVPTFPDTTWELVIARMNIAKN